MIGDGPDPDRPAHASPGPSLSPRGFLLATFWTGLLSGPLFVAIMFVVEPLLPEVSGQRFTGVDGLLMIFVSPFSTLPFTFFPSLFLGFPATLALATLLLMLGDGIRVLRRWHVWLIAGGAAGVPLGAIAFSVVKPLNEHDRLVASLIGSLDGACCAFVLHRLLRLRGAFRR